jgi:Xaa-Pro aminopeptidase
MIQKKGERFAKRPLIIFLLCLFLTISASAAFGQNRFDKAEFAARRAKLIEKIGDGVAVIFSNEAHPYSVKFRQSPDFYYLTGIEEPNSVLVINGARKLSAVFAPKRSPQKIAIEGAGLREVANPGEVYGLAVLPVENFYTIFPQVLGNSKKLYVQVSPPDDLQFGRFEMAGEDNELMQNPLFGRVSETKRKIEMLQKWQPQLQIGDVSPMLDELRWVKTPYEIERMRMSGRIGAEGIKEAMKGTKPGMYEYEIEAAARFVYVKRGARGDAFLPIVASGANTMTLHYTANNRQMQAGDIVYIDYGADYDYYTSDITRTWAVSGKFSPDEEKMYRCILEARNVIVAMMKPGITVKDMQDAAEPVYKKHGFLEQFKKFGRYVGHYVGLSVHDPGDSGGEPKSFVAGVVFNVEPLIQNEEKKIHLRLEDTILITPTGAENLTASVPAELEEIYALTRQPALGSGLK